MRLPFLPKRSSLSDRCRFLAFAGAEIIESRATCAALLFHFQFRNPRRMQRKHPLHAFTVRDPAHGESFIETAALAADHYAGKDLDSFLVAFHDSRVDSHTVTNRKHCGI